MLLKLVIEKLKFRSASQHADTYFHQDLRAYGFKAFLDTSNIVRHYPSKMEEF